MAMFYIDGNPTSAPTLVVQGTQLFPTFPIMTSAAFSCFLLVHCAGLQPHPLLWFILPLVLRAWVKSQDHTNLL